MGCNCLLLASSIQLQDKERTPRLKQVAEKCLDVFEQQVHDENCVRNVLHIMEGLFDHFFSEHRLQYEQSDVQWFLKLVNREFHWPKSSIQSMSSGASASKNVLDQLSDGVLRLYLHRILKPSPLQEKKAPVPETLLAIFNPVVRF